ncbi:hypothetical protein EVAR_82463_1 [Eumeta japonica]|uniref:Uncharacterized protein n=1 Tax=Eumeta variegata TaxID=151549 RepID=A0A4C1X424_EUMVA|nr:hypothetical protein EVAR_82463_1 [Eumeta japonica]
MEGDRVDGREREVKLRNLTQWMKDNSRSCYFTSVFCECVVFRCGSLLRAAAKLTTRSSLHVRASACAISHKILGRGHLGGLPASGQARRIPAPSLRPLTPSYNTDKAMKALQRNFHARLRKPAEGHTKNYHLQDRDPLPLYCLIYKSWSAAAAGCSLQRAAGRGHGFIVGEQPRSACGDLRDDSANLKTIRSVSSRRRDRGQPKPRAGSAPHLDIILTS